MVPREQAVSDLIEKLTGTPADEILVVDRCPPDHVLCAMFGGRFWGDHYVEAPSVDRTDAEVLEDIRDQINVLVLLGAIKGKA